MIRDAWNWTLDLIENTRDGISWRAWLAVAKSLRFVTRWVATLGPGEAMRLEGTLEDMDETIAEWEKDFETWKNS